MSSSLPLDEQQCQFEYSTDEFQRLIKENQALKAKIDELHASFLAEKEKITNMNKLRRKQIRNLLSTATGHWGPYYVYQFLSREEDEEERENKRYSSKSY
jgi:hypothetical protein